MLSNDFIFYLMSTARTSRGTNNLEMNVPNISDYCLISKFASNASLGTFRSDYNYEYEYQFFNVYPVRMPDCVRLSRQLILSSKFRRRLDANFEILNKSRPPTTSSLQVQRRVKRLVIKGADTLWNVPCKLSRNVLATLWHLVLFVY